MLAFKQEFRETICRLYAESTEQTLYTLVEGQTDPAADPLTLTVFTQAVLSPQFSFYDLLQTQEGFLTMQRYFIKAVLLLD